MMSSTNKVAVSCTPQIGDGLVYLTLAHLLAINGYQVTFYSNPVSQLQAFFPNIDLQPEVPVEQWPATAAAFSKVYLCTRTSAYTSDFDHTEQKDKFVYLPDFAAKDLAKTEQIADYVKTQLLLPKFEPGNGFRLPNTLSSRRHAQRVLLHPTSTDVRKNWPAEKFIRLAKKLEQQGYMPIFVVSPAEREEWQKRVKPSQLIPKMPSLGEVTAYIAESGWFIGNDSGVGHLASMCGIPTLTIFRHPNRAKLWQPCWSPNMTVSAVMPIKQWELWKQQLTIGRVLAHFKRLVNSLPPSAHQEETAKCG